MLANAAARRRMVRALFCSVSRLGDGMAWYALMAMMPLWLGWTQGLRAASHMLLVGAVGLVLYKFLKRTLVRERPFVGLVGIECAMPPLDRYSFPSGHTLHAVSFTLVALAHYPGFAAWLIPFTASIAVSRVFLGVHYPSDVLAATGIGATLAGIALWAVPGVSLFG